MTYRDRITHIVKFDDRHARHAVRRLRAQIRKGTR